MLGKLFNFNPRPRIDSQNTGNLVYQRPQGPAFTSMYGSAGIPYHRTINGAQPMGITSGPTIRVVDPAATGNISYTLGLQPLINDTKV